MSFRASPWIHFNAEPHPDHPRSDNNIRFRSMNEDVDMDAPQISTLREEASPEPQASRTSKFRVKLLMGDNKRAGSSAGTVSAKKADANPDTEDEDEDDEDEEDQLIDDDDDEPKAAPPPVAVVSAPVPAEKRTTGAKRGAAAGGRGRGRGRGGRGKLARTDGSVGMIPGSSTDGLSTITIPPTSISAPAPSPARKRGGAPKAAGQRAPRKRAPKTATAVPPHMRDDAGGISETYAGTAPSSPGGDEPSPDFLDIPLPAHNSAMLLAPSAEDMNLDGVALPSYPLPNKPFPVHPPPKIGSGFATVTPLDKSGKKVRHWRQANREVRGIGGGRWFVKAWIGDKESEYATAHAAAPPPIPAATQATALAMIGDRELMPAMTTVPIPRLGGTSSGRGRQRGALATNPSSRAQSTGADSISGLSKRRTATQASSTVDTPLSATAPSV